MQPHAFSSIPPTFVTAIELQQAVADQSAKYWVAVTDSYDANVPPAAYPFDTETAAMEFAGKEVSCGSAVWLFYGVRIPLTVPYNPVSPFSPPLVLELVEGRMPADDELAEIRANAFTARQSPKRIETTADDVADVEPQDTEEDQWESEVAEVADDTEELEDGQTAFDQLLPEDEARGDDSGTPGEDGDDEWETPN